MCRKAASIGAAKWIFRVKALNCFEKIFLITYQGTDWPIPHGGGWDDALDFWETVCGRVTSFRVSCKKSSSSASSSSSLDLERSLGSVLQDHFAWPLQLRSPHLEVWLFVTEDCHTAGLLLLRQAQARPVYTSSTGLHPNVAWAMVTAAAIQSGEVVLDPMCGTGMLLTEASDRNALLIGSDISPEMLTRAARHFQSLRRTAPSNGGALLQADVRHLPLPDGSVDVVLCDLPFGRQFGTLEENQTLYPAALRELHRVADPWHGRCVLLSSEVNAVLLRQSAEAAGWKMQEELTWKLGNKLPAVVMILTAQSASAPHGDLSAFSSKGGRFAVQRKQQSPELVLCTALWHLLVSMCLGQTDGTGMIMGPTNWAPKSKWNMYSNLLVMTRTKGPLEGYSKEVYLMVLMNGLLGLANPRMTRDAKIIQSLATLSVAVVLSAWQLRFSPGTGFWRSCLLSASALGLYYGDQSTLYSRDHEVFGAWPSWLNWTLHRGSSRSSREELPKMV
ncbi:THUMP domain-containing protein 3 [Durusdinium trenchii]|uniref:THUMP domain-containing protein 3 n=1 Tax=Durusdinium trenchii TaxID=1381693 RepID=A0ABP0MQ75_9DINO